MYTLFIHMYIYSIVLPLGRKKSQHILIYSLAFIPVKMLFVLFYLGMLKSNLLPETLTNFTRKEIYTQSHLRPTMHAVAILCIFKRVVNIEKLLLTSKILIVPS